MTAIEQAQGLLAYLRFLVWNHQVHHWQSSGPTFYSDHELFGRLYDETNGLIDPLAERAVAQFGSVVVSQAASIGILVEVTRSALSQQGTDAEQALEFVRGALDLYGSLREQLETENLLTTGWEDLLDGQAHSLESHEYLLQQRVGMAKRVAQLETDWFGRGITASDYKAQLAPHIFMDNPDKRSVNELYQSRALSNLPDSGQDKPSAPDTPVENRENTPGGDQFSTLSRFLVQTEHNTGERLPNSREDLPRHPKIMGES